MYFLPGLDPGNVTPEALAMAGLDTPFRDLLPRWKPPHNVVVNAVHSRGPNGSSGCMVYPIPVNHSQPRSNGYKPESQSWHDCGSFWLGVDTEKPPSPDDLRRPQLISGYDRVLGDGRAWTCPILRQPLHMPGDGLCSWGVDKSGEFARHVLDEFAWAWDLSAEIWDACMVAGKLNFGDAWQMAVNTLSVNYRIGPHEATALKLLTDNNFVTVLHAAIDSDLVQELVNQSMGDEGPPTEKKSSEPPEPSANSTPGPAVDAPATDPVEAHST